MPEDANFADGQGPRSKDTPAEFPSDWHYQAEVEAIEQDLAGGLARLEELKAMQDVPAATIQGVEDRIAAAKARLAQYSKGQKSASKRPRAKAETRAKK